MPPAPRALREEEQPQQCHDGLPVESNKTAGTTSSSSSSTNNTNWCTCRGQERPVESMIGTWVFLILLPAAALAWHSTKRVSVVVGATLATPALAILQGTIGILTYRVYFGDAPLPQTPSHGVVCCVEQEPQPQRDAPNHVDQKKKNNRDRLSSSKQKKEKGENTKVQVTTTPQSLRRLSGTRRRQPAPIAGLPLPSLGCECAGGHSSSCTAISTSSTTALLSRPKSAAPEQAAAAAAETKTPLRLLVVGDSLAIGVGQAKSCTPILPETIAKTLSQKMGGRLVYWTCHGAPGASTGWIVREIERGGSLTKNKDKEDKNNNNKQPEQRSSEELEENDNNDENELESLPGKVDIMSNCSDTDESSSDDESSSSTSDGESTERRRRHYVRSGVYRGNDDKDENNDGHEEDQHASTSDEHGTTTTTTASSSSSSIPLSQWKENLAQHKKRFDHPEVLGPYDVVVVLTGSNDLKSAFFPFLLSGEDAEFRRQARERGGSYTMELRRLRNALFQKTAVAPERVIHSIVHTVEVATESVRERVEETLEYIAPGSSSRLPHSPRAALQQEQQQQRLQHGHAPTAAADGDKSSLPEQLPLLRDKDKPAGDESSVNDDEDGNDDTTTWRQQQQHPLVVLPGMPARSLPIFSRRPLRWLAVPIVDIMDMHKRNFAKAHPGEVAFVPAPSVNDLSRYVTRTGPVWEQKQAEHTILALRDIKRQDCRRIESDMRRYYHHGGDKGGSSSSSSPWSMLRKILPKSSFWPSRRGSGSSSSHPPGSKLFSVDQVHPRDEGYDFWGRYIGASIADEMQKLKR